MNEKGGAGYAIELRGFLQPKCTLRYFFDDSRYPSRILCNAFVGELKLVTKIENNWRNWDVNVTLPDAITTKQFENGKLVVEENYSVLNFKKLDRIPEHLFEWESFGLSDGALVEYRSPGVSGDLKEWDAETKSFKPFVPRPEFENAPMQTLPSNRLVNSNNYLLIVNVFVVCILAGLLLWRHYRN